MTSKNYLILHMSHVSMLVSLLMKKLCTSMHYLNTTDVSEYKYFGKAAFFHDLGKVLVPKHILIKPGRLTKGEFYILQRHTLYAKELFNMIKDNKITGIPVNLISLAYDAALYHHEWWNGKGYPYGASHEDIPVIARVTSVCDAYDAITSDRIYRKAHTHDYACQELKANSGTQFDPALVKVFLDNEKKFLPFCKWVDRPKVH